MQLDHVRKNLFRRRILAFLSLILETAFPPEERERIRNDIRARVREAIDYSRQDHFDTNIFAKYYLRCLIKNIRDTHTNFHVDGDTEKTLLNMVLENLDQDDAIAWPSLQQETAMIAQVHDATTQQKESDPSIFVDCVNPAPQLYLDDQGFRDKTSCAPTVLRYVREGKIPGKFIMDEKMSSALIDELESMLESASDETVVMFFKYQSYDEFFSSDYHSLSNFDYKKVKSFLALLAHPFIKEILATVSAKNFVYELNKLHQHHSDQDVLGILNVYKKHGVSFEHFVVATHDAFNDSMLTAEVYDRFLQLMKHPVIVERYSSFKPVSEFDSLKLRTENLLMACAHGQEQELIASLSDPDVMTAAKKFNYHNWLLLPLGQIFQSPEAKAIVRSIPTGLAELDLGLDSGITVRSVLQTNKLRQLNPDPKVRPYSLVPNMERWIELPQRRLLTSTFGGVLLKAFKVLSAELAELIKSKQFPDKYNEIIDHGLMLAVLCCHNEYLNDLLVDVCNELFNQEKIAEALQVMRLTPDLISQAKIAPQLAELLMTTSMQLPALLRQQLAFFLLRRAGKSDGLSSVWKRQAFQALKMGTVKTATDKKDLASLVDADDVTTFELLCEVAVKLLDHLMEQAEWKKQFLIPSYLADSLVPLLQMKFYTPQAFTAIYNLLFVIFREYKAHLDPNLVAEFSQLKSIASYEGMLLAPAHVVVAKKTKQTNCH